VVINAAGARARPPGRHALSRCQSEPTGSSGWGQRTLALLHACAVAGPRGHPAPARAGLTGHPPRGLPPRTIAHWPVAASPRIRARPNSAWRTARRTRG